jgi:hypothetical protein
MVSRSRPAEWADRANRNDLMSGRERAEKNDARDLCKTASLELGISFFDIAIEGLEPHGDAVQGFNAALGRCDGKRCHHIAKRQIICHGWLRTNMGEIKQRAIEAT